MGFGASWVFLYPLPFHSAGEWSDTAAGIFSASVLLTGVSIITWCLAILNTVIGPGLGSPDDASFANRLGAALGFGYIWPNRFRTSRPLPYAVIPLTVIGVDMIIATLPLAALLVVMILQSIDPSVTIDDQLAKNLLWFFGHPVVYLLLFPSVAVFYLLVPRYAKKELVAGRVVAFAWMLAVFVNVIIWAHHIYLDYPKGSIQAALNTSMQPLTFAITLPSAISLYSLSATIWRSDFQWTPAAKFLAAAMVSWLVAGLQGVINATIVLRRRHPQHDVDRRALPQHGAAQHRPGDLRLGLRVHPAADRPRVVLREPRQLPPVAHRHRRVRHGAADARAGPRGRAAALRRAARAVRRRSPS